MLLSEILLNIKTIKKHNTNIDINNICDDSRKIKKGDLFVAISGNIYDGHKFIDTAIDNGAVAIVIDSSSGKAEELTDSNVEVIVVENTASILGLLASNFYGNPSDKLKLVGVTGTNGKTTIATLLYRLFTDLGFKVGLLSTIRNYVNHTPIETINTTPNVLETNRLLVEMLHQGCDYCFMEVSSHAVVQHRITGLNFAGGIFTNITQDHLDYHGTMKEYRDAKKGFFDLLPQTAFALTNIDDRNGMFMLQNTKATKRTYSTSTIADFKTKIVENSFEGLSLQISTYCTNVENRHYDIMTPFVGKFNAQNLTAVFGSAVLLSYNSKTNVSTEDIAVKLTNLFPVAGRFETLRLNGITAIVDYAHTPDALKNVLETIADIKGIDSSIITVVGCGGDRDKTKRPLMAKESVALSDTVVLTSDNPRTENPHAILDDMLSGLNDQQQRKTIVISDRKQAIKTACRLAKSGDIILIAGKGHENYQIIGSTKHHFDDKEEVLAALGE